MIGIGAIAAGVLASAGIYLLLSRNTQRLLFGFLLFSNGMNLSVIVARGSVIGSPPLIGETPPLVDPLPQAFILTAIVIGLGASAFLMAMALRAKRERGTDELREEEEP